MSRNNVSLGLSLPTKMVYYKAMKIQPKAFRRREDLKNHIRSHAETLFYSSCTSTVIPYPNLGKILSDRGVKHLYMGDLNAMPQKISLHLSLIHI